MITKDDIVYINVMDDEHTLVRIQDGPVDKWICSCGEEEIL